MKKLSYVLTTAAAFLLSSSDLNYAIGAEQEQIDQIVSVVERLCLAGSAYRLQADAKGNLTLTKLLPGGEGSISANV